MAAWARRSGARWASSIFAGPLALACAARAGGTDGTAPATTGATRGLELEARGAASGAALRPQDVYSRSVAAVIGIDTYEALPDLSGAVRDARAVAAALRARDFQVTTLYDAAATKLGITELLGDVLARDLGEDDRVFVYFAGHGASTGTKEHRTGYLLPVDGRRDRPVSTGISMTELNNWLAGYPSKHVMFVADACYSGLALATRSTGLDPGTRGYLRDITTRRVRFSLVAGADDQEAHEWQGMGVFTRFLLEAIEGGADFNGDGLVTSDEIASHVKPRVASFVNQNYAASQTPQSARTGLGEFVFFVDRAPEPVAHPGPNRLVTDRGPALRRLRAGTFTMGSATGEEDEKPPHEVSVAAFFLDETEVTVAQYRACVEAGECPEPPATTGEGAAEDSLCNYRAPHRERHPVNCVTLPEAATFCSWAQKRLPTEQEWEYAARGAEGRTYPWGSAAPASSRANACGPECVALAASLGFVFSAAYADSDGYGSTAPVGSFAEGSTPEGLADLAGNVWEWTETELCPYDAPGCGSGAWVIRGGGWNVGGPEALRTTYRFAATADVRRSIVGFRCARSATERAKARSR